MIKQINPYLHIVEIDSMIQAPHLNLFSFTVNPPTEHLEKVETF